MHIKVHSKWEPMANGTFVTGGIVHTGQFFVEDHVNEVVDKMHPYTENPIRHKWGRTRNWADSEFARPLPSLLFLLLLLRRLTRLSLTHSKTGLKIYEESHQNGYFPTFDLTKLGGNIQSGLHGAITVGVDLKKDYVSFLRCAPRE